MPKKSTKETEIKIAAETAAPKKRAAVSKTAASPHKRAATKLEVAPAATAQASPATANPGPAAINHAVESDQIARVAYFLWLERGATPGDPEQDWFRAERIVRSSGQAVS